ncbi:hypothetical protein ACJEBK_16520 [Peribacillus frigoritolerans]|uniref:hypothetical protein n=1 Tax=Peribacillus frigoritolerans TaxID=450367 RepID=UPI0038724E2D
MSMTPFEQIRKFCTDKNLSKMHERFLYHKYVEDLTSLIDSYHPLHGKEPSDEVKEGFKGTLISENTLSTNVRLADDEFKELTNKEIVKVKKKASFLAFSVDVVSGVVASFVFTLLLILIFSLGQSQFKSWINDLYDNNNHIEKKVNNIK